MALPNVNVTLNNGALGTQSDSLDGIAGIILSGIATEKIALNTPNVIYKLQDAVDLGITEQTNPSAYRHIKEFYQGYNYIASTEVATLWIMLVAASQTMTMSSDITNESGAKLLLDQAAGAIRLLGFTKNPGSDYEPDLTNGIDADTITALSNAHSLGNTYYGKMMPFRAFVEGRNFEAANIGTLKDLKTYTYNRTACVLMSSSNDGSASVGFVLGVAAALPVQRKLSRVANGVLPLSTLYIGDTSVEKLSGIDAVHDKGYIIARTFPTRSGFYFNGDPMATLSTDDYNNLANGRVIDKAAVIAYDTYLGLLDDDVEVDQTTGQVDDGYLGYMESIIKDAILKKMDGNISGEALVNIPTGQNILANSKTKVQLKITPKGYNSQINVELGFYNPANTETTDSAS